MLLFTDSVTENNTTKYCTEVAGYKIYPKINHDNMGFYFQQIFFNENNYI